MITKEITDALKKFDDAKAELAKHRQGLITEIKGYIKALDIKAAEIGFADKEKSQKNTATAEKLPAKYTNEATGETWSGRGRRPKWVELDPANQVPVSQAEKVLSTASASKK